MGVHLMAPNGHLAVVHVDAQPDRGHAEERPHPPTLGGFEPEEVEVDEHRTRERRAELLEAVETHDPDLVLFDVPTVNRRTRPYVADVRWLREHANRTALFFRFRGLEDINTIAIMGSGGPADVVKITVAHRLAHHTGATLRFAHLLSEQASDEEVASIARYHRSLGELITVRTESRVVRAPDLLASLDRLTDGADLVILGAASRISTRFSDLSERIASELDLPVLTVRPQAPHKPTLRRRFLERIIY